ncbi:uncharacterized protein LOC127010374 [Eriocheir sinensis]|uniref:uncharacterized protein LOC127010374 n=1 Tax=Eriocheir sinensis TaxID=95602 RepID=UPI0021C78F3F|nr:uncharacterized protein LOC127010374 [Eriocheir sinensis]XP_050740332.1 uncharacterized protein LOC127010374 [Eriocheir sinensis]XP_050740333.1 uncharacterized protein LOC127010374 [Eriocheir sinensis]XP_050740334.1 uncharacterized protein LOC127010374 [Eriocheir sinensis]XP_050740335.1 uncharacterized protein LOC127010374 [Eriocheir sinensis]XP_050740336.1 uncharacterized protein LOC127010374 [Eriocheir sinensis]
MATEERHVNLQQKGETQERLGLSLDKLEQKYEQALQEWERLATLEKEVVGPTKRRKHLPKRLPKLDIVSGTSDNELPDQAIREQLAKALSECRAEEVMVRALESTLESQNRRLESERKQQHQLQQQLQAILNEKEELQKLMHKAEIHFQRVAPVIENAERRLADNAEKLRKIDEDIMKIRRDAVELLQIHQARHEVEGQVEALSGSITALQEQKAAALERMRDSQEEEVKLYHGMKAAIKKVCVQHSENLLELEGRYEILWSNVDHLLDCCNKLLQQTRPEVEALKVGTHHQTVKSSGAQQSVILSQADTRGNILKVTSSGAQPSVQVSDSQTAMHDIVCNEDVSSKSQYCSAYDEAQLLSANTVGGNAERVLCESITTEGSVGGSPTADDKLSGPSDAHPNLLLQDQITSGHSKHSSQELFIVKAVKTETSGNSVSVLNDTYYPTNIIHQNDQAMTVKVPVSQGYSTTAISPLPTVIYMQSKSHIPPMSPVHTLSACHIESITINEPTFPLLQKESYKDKDTVLVIDEVNEEEIDVYTDQAEDSPHVATELKCNIITTAASILGHLPQNTVIIVTERKSSSVPDN